MFDNPCRNGSRDNLAWLQNQGKFAYENGDIRSQNDIARVIQAFRPVAIFHLAGRVVMQNRVQTIRAGTSGVFLK